jgi:hypothetical protein
MEKKDLKEGIRTKQGHKWIENSYKQGTTRLIQKY